MKKRRRPISDINVVPYLDVMLVLLVIFMITAPLFNQGVVDSPSVGNTPLTPREANALEIVYFPSGEGEGEKRFQLINHKHGSETPQLSLEELMQELKLEQHLRPNAPVAIAADPESLHGDVFDLLGQLRDQGFERIGFVAKTSDG